LLLSELRGDDHCSTLHKESCRLGHNEDFVTKLCQILRNCSQRCRLAGTWAASQKNSGDVNSAI
jgi:hypothetical protein